MEENFNPVARTRANYYTPGSPVQFVCVELLKGELSGENAVCLTFKNISKVTLTALEIHFKCKGVDGIILCEDAFEYREIEVKPGESFGMDDAVFVTQKAITSVDVVLKNVYSGKKVVHLDAIKRVRLPAPRRLSPELEKALESRMNRTGLKYMPQVFENGWYCACGSFHPKEEDTVYCTECGCDRILLQNALNTLLQPGISTRYRDREASVQAVSDALAALARAKVGNYLAFFPSYAYLRKVYEDFTARYPDIGTLAQESGLDDAARAAFLEQFGPSPAKTLLGFGVMGGIFGEGVDLVGDRLIGCAIVGVGLPQVNPRQEILRRYYDEAGGTGFDYAYRFPGMNKVLQAAGRVIRTQEDRGVVLLLDDRFARAEYTRLFPRHWHQLQYLRSTTELEQQLTAFWALNQ